MPPDNLLNTLGQEENTSAGPPVLNLAIGVPVWMDSFPIAENTAKPAMKENMEFAIAITHEFTKAGSSRGMCDPYAVIIPNVTLREKKICETAVDQASPLSVEISHSPM